MCTAINEWQSSNFSQVLHRTQIKMKLAVILLAMHYVPYKFIKREHQCCSRHVCLEKRRAARYDRDAALDQCLSRSRHSGIVRH